jgi:hypothetical protein
MQWINGKTPKLRQKMTDIGVPDFNAGYNSSQGSFHSFNNSGNIYHKQQFDSGINAIQAVEDMRTIDAAANGRGKHGTAFTIGLA